MGSLNQDAGARAADARARIDRVASFMRLASFELASPELSEFEALRDNHWENALIYLTPQGGRPAEDLVSAALNARRCGLTPTPHIAARQFKTFDELERLLTRLNREAGVDRIMLIGGDAEASSGAIKDAMSVIESGILENHGVISVGLAGFPDGHPKLSEDELEVSLVTKIAAAQKAGLEAHVVTQFCSDAAPILRWLAWLRARGIHCPVRVGFAGPISLMKWLAYARKCGVKASAEALAANSGLARHVFKSVTPDRMVEAVAGVADRLGDVQPHFYGFGGVRATARWAWSLASGDVVLTPDGGIEPRG